MRFRCLAVVGIGSLLAAGLGACAEGAGRVPEISRSDSVREETPVQVVEAAGTGGGAAAEMEPEEEAYTGEECMRGETQECTCRETGTLGEKVCRYDPASPTMGTFSECINCADPEPLSSSSAGDINETMSEQEEEEAAPEEEGPAEMEPVTDCSDNMQNGLETDVDCGGPDCPTCLIGEGCNETSDCSAGECLDGVCGFDDPEPPPSVGRGGGGGGGSSSGGGDGALVGPDSIIGCNCTNDCFPIGILPCCNALGLCGCTWAPGAYCL